MEIEFRDGEVILIWPAGELPQWAWDIAADDNKSLCCYGAYENALSIQLW